MQFGTLAGLERRGHGVIVGSICMACLIAFSIACFSDVNHPPGVRTVRLEALSVILLVSGIEFFCAWFGIALFTLVWPYPLLIKYLLVRDISGLFSSLPDIFDWPLAAGLTVAISLRQLRTIPPDSIKIDLARAPLFLRFMPALFYAFATITAVSAVLGISHLRGAPAAWNVSPIDPRHLLLVSNPLSIMRLLWVGIPIIVNCMFAIAIFRSVLFERSKSYLCRIPLWTFMLSMFTVMLMVVSQIRGEWNWSAFDDGAPGGPFSNRNGVAPMLVLASIVALAVFKYYKFIPVRVASIVAVIIFNLVALRTGSRNGILLVVAIPWAFLWVGATTFRMVALVLVPAFLAISILLWLPLPPSESVSSESIRRSINTAEKVRAGDWDAASSYRNQLWSVAGKTWARYPLFGSGPGTFYIFSSQVPETRSDLIRSGQVPGIAAHSTPMNLLAEEGLFASLLWISIWLIVPATLLACRPFSPLALGIFILGIANIFDTPWYVSGGAAIASIWLVASTYDNLSRALTLNRRI